MTSICLFFVLYYTDDFFVYFFWFFFFFFFWSDRHSSLAGKNWNSKGKKKEKNGLTKEKNDVRCTGRESNPGLPRGRREFYHWTTSAHLRKPMKIVNFKHKKIQTRLKYFFCLALLVFYSVKCPNTGSFRKPITQNSVVDFYWLDTWTSTWTVSIRHHQITHESIRCPMLPVWFTLFISPGKCCITVSYPYNLKRFLWYQTIILSLKPSWVPYLLGESRH